MAIVAYVFFFIPLFTGAHKNSNFVKYHTNQGTILAIFSFAIGIVIIILTAILTAIATATFSFRVLMIIPIISVLLWLIPLALVILGIINTATGKMKPLPVIGKLTIIK
jgi:uncharacterized membrane protein